MNYRHKFTWLGLVASFLIKSVLANEDVLANGEQKEVVSAVASLMQSNYVFADKGEAMAKRIKNKLASGEYKQVSNADEFARLLTEDLREVSNDLHIRVRFAPEHVKDMRTQDAIPDDEELLARQKRQLQQQNYGFKQVAILPGNIGYIDLREFVETETAQDTAVAAMNFVANADALIIDLRKNGGGSPSMIQLITSYLYDEKPVHLNSFYWRPDDETSETWTFADVSGKRRPDMPVYVLTSKRTFSAAEEFSYNLKHLKRATIIGETTGGGAHPGGTEVATDRFTVWIPIGRAINPITKTNWEGTGVKPHIEVNAKNALAEAKKQALLKFASESQEKDFYLWHLAHINAKLNPVKLTAELLAQYAGDYGDRLLTVKNGNLYYQRKGRGEPKPLLAIEKDTFQLPDADDFRLKVLSDNGKVVALQGLYISGYKDKSPRVSD